MYCEVDIFSVNKNHIIRAAFAANDIPRLKNVLFENIVFYPHHDVAFPPKILLSSTPIYTRFYLLYSYLCSLSTPTNAREVL